jgi:hypothetical protein
MSAYPFGRCRRVTLNGARCTMPAHHTGDLCFEHEQRIRLVRSRRPSLPDTDIREPLVKFAYMEDHASILHNLNAIALAFANHQIDHRQVGVMTYLMQTCLKTLRQMNQLEIRPTLNEVLTDVVYDDQGLPLAAPDSATDPIPNSISIPTADPIPNSISDPPSDAASDQPTPELIELHAVAAASADRDPLSFQSQAPQPTPFQTLATRRKITRPFSNTCISDRGRGRC